MNKSLQRMSLGSDSQGDLGSRLYAAGTASTTAAFVLPKNGPAKKKGSIGGLGMVGSSSLPSLHAGKDNVALGPLQKPATIKNFKKVCQIF
jgi:hypothetical protein